MTDYREVLRLASLGLNYTQIAESAGTSRKTVRRVLDRAGEAEVDWVKAQGMPDKDLACALYPSAVAKGAYKMPDCEAIHREMAKPGVTLQLVWMEYCEQCRASGDLPYQLSQFKKLYREYAIQTKATMHIAHKPGEIMEVDWAGQRATVVDNETGECLEAYLFVAVLPYSGYRRRTRLTTDRLPEGLPVEIVEHDLPKEEQICPSCGGDLHVMGRETRRELVIVPAQLKIREHVRKVYACRDCEKDECGVPIVKAPKDEPVIKGSFASPEAVSYMMTQKFVMGVPLYRQEQQ